MPFKDYKPYQPFKDKRCSQCGDMEPFHRFIGACDGIHRVMDICDFCRCENRLSETDKNLFFRGGDYEHTFEYGCTIIKDWMGKTEFEVLLQRVGDGLKPFAVYVVRSSEDWKAIFNTSKYKDKITLVSDASKWSVPVLRFCLTENLHVKLDEYRPDIDFTSPPHEFRYYLNNGCDMSKEDTYEECGVLYGYW